MSGRNIKSNSIMSEFFCLPFFCPIIPFNVGVLFFRFAEFWTTVLAPVEGIMETR
jgi:hypothetical protein